MLSPTCPSPPWHSPGKAAHRCLPASQECRSRSRLWGCRLPHWHRCSSRCSSGPMSHWDMAGCSPGPATLRGGKGTVTSPSRPSVSFCPLPPALHTAFHPNHCFPEGWVRTHIPHRVQKYNRAVRRAGARTQVSCLRVLIVCAAGR